MKAEFRIVGLVLFSCLSRGEGDECGYVLSDPIGREMADVYADLMDLSIGSDAPVGIRWAFPEGCEISFDNSVLRLEHDPDGCISLEDYHFFRLLDERDRLVADGFVKSCKSETEAVLWASLQTANATPTIGNYHAALFTHSRSPCRYPFQVFNYDCNRDLTFDYGTDTRIVAGAHVVALRGAPSLDKAALAAALLQAGGIRTPDPIPMSEWMAEWTREAERFLNALGVDPPLREADGMSWSPPQKPVSLPKSVVVWALRWRTEIERQMTPTAAPGAIPDINEAEKGSRGISFPLDDLTVIVRSEASSRPPALWNVTVSFTDGIPILFCCIHALATDEDAHRWFGERVGAFYALSRPRYLKTNESLSKRHGLILVRAWAETPNHPWSNPTRPPVARQFVLGPRTVMDVQSPSTCPLPRRELLDLCAAILRAGGVEVPDDGE